MKHTKVFDEYVKHTIPVFEEHYTNKNIYIFCGGMTCTKCPVKDLCYERLTDKYFGLSGEEVKQILIENPEYAI